MYSLKELALSLGGYVHGDDAVTISHLAALKSAKTNQLSFLANSKYLADLKTTAASAVLLTKEMLEFCPTNAIVLDNPYLAFAKIAHLFDRTPKAKTGIHPSASIAHSATIAKNASIAANVVIGENVMVAENAVIGANCVILDNSSLGQNTEIKLF